MKSFPSRCAILAVAAGLVAWPATGAADEKPPAPAKPTAQVEIPASPAPAGGARMTLESETVDLGDVVKGQLATAVFTIRNTGEDLLKILEAKPG